VQGRSSLELSKGHVSVNTLVLNFWPPELWEIFWFCLLRPGLAIWPRLVWNSILLPQPPKCWAYRGIPPHSANFSCFKPPSLWYFVNAALSLKCVWYVCVCIWGREKEGKTTFRQRLFLVYWPGEGEQDASPKREWQQVMKVVNGERARTRCAESAPWKPGELKTVPTPPQWGGRLRKTRMLPVQDKDSLAPRHPALTPQQDAYVNLLQWLCSGNMYLALTKWQALESMAVGQSGPKEPRS
jgi:hypothetical protein